jgi:hypothetical protein
MHTYQEKKQHEIGWALLWILKDIEYLSDSEGPTNKPIICTLVSKINYSLEFELLGNSYFHMSGAVRSLFWYEAEI